MLELPKVFQDKIIHMTIKENVRTLEAKRLIKGTKCYIHSVKYHVCELRNILSAED